MIIDLYLEYVVYAQEYKVINMWMNFVFECKYRPKYYVMFKNKERFFILYEHSYVFRLYTTHLEEVR